MKCRHCKKDIPNRDVLTEAARIMGRESKRILSTEDAKAMAEKSHEARRKNADTDRK